MKNPENTVNVFWFLVWAIVLILAVAGIFGSKVCLYILAVVALGFATMFLVDYIQVKKLR